MQALCGRRILHNLMILLLFEVGTGGDRLFKRQGEKREQDLVQEETRFCY